MIKRDPAVNAKTLLSIVSETDAAAVATWIDGLLHESKKVVDGVLSVLQRGATVDRPPEAIRASLRPAMDTVRFNAHIYQRIAKMRGFKWPEEVKAKAEGAGKEFSMLVIQLDAYTQELEELLGELPKGGYKMTSS